MTHILSGPATHQLFLRSLQPMVRAIGSSLGPDGRVTLFNLGGSVGQAASGVSIAREIAGTNGLQSVAQKMLREALVDAERELGDGTARLALMAESAFRAGTVHVAAGTSATKLAEALWALRDEVSERIADERCDGGEFEDIAMTTGADADFSAALAALFRQTGTTGIIELEPSRHQEMTIVKSAGFVFDVETIGTPLPVGEVLEFKDPFIIAADDIISDFGSLAPVIEGFAAKRKPLMVVARDVNGSALATIERNRKAGILSVLVAKPADAGPRAAHLVEDLALATGAVLVSQRSGQSLASLKPNMLGRAASLRMTGQRVELMHPAGNKEDIDARAAVIDADIRKFKYLSLDREHAERRRARLLGQWAIIRIGGATTFETERMTVIGRNALASLRSAAASGVIPGGSEALIRIARSLASRGGNEFEAMSGKIVATALSSIHRHLKQNSGNHDIFPPNTTAALPNTSINQRPIYDPLRMTQLLVDQALSIAGLLLRVDAAVVRSWDEKAAMSPNMTRRQNR